MKPIRRGSHVRTKNVVRGPLSGPPIVGVVLHQSTASAVCVEYPDFPPPTPGRHWVVGIDEILEVLS